MWFKIVEIKDFKLLTLFHANRGSRRLTRNEWLRAEARIVSDGTNGTKYTSGWHVIPTRSEARVYLKRFTSKQRRLIILPVWAHDVRKKTHSTSPIYLARTIYIGSWPDESRTH